jgi:hypothetical protein
MAEELGPGRRAFGYLAFELGVTPARCFDDIDALREHNLIDGAEALGIEKSYAMLSPEVSPEFCLNLGSIEAIDALKLSSGLVQRYARNFAIAARWHRWRGRAEAAARFERYSLACEAWLAWGVHVLQRGAN